MNPNQIYVSPQGQLLGPQGQALGYTVVQTPQGLVAVPNQMGMGQAAPAPSPVAQAQQKLAGASPLVKLLLAAGVVGGLYWAWKRYVKPRMAGTGERGDLREKRARRSRSRLLAEMKRFLEQHPTMREEFPGVAEESESESRSLAAHECDSGCDHAEIEAEED